MTDSESPTWSPLKINRAHTDVRHCWELEGRFLLCGIPQLGVTFWQSLHHAGPRRLIPRLHATDTLILQVRNMNLTFQEMVLHPLDFLSLASTSSNFLISETQVFSWASIPCLEAEVWLCYCILGAYCLTPKSSLDYLSTSHNLSCAHCGKRQIW